MFSDSAFYVWAERVRLLSLMRYDFIDKDIS